MSPLLRTAIALTVAATACKPSHSNTLPDGGNACSGSVAFVEANCLCDSAAACQGERTSVGECGSWACTPAHACLPICCCDADCPTGEVCEDLICRPGGLCDGPDACGPGKQCIGGSCQTPVPGVARCVIEPSTSVMNAGARRTFSIVGYDKDGRASPYAGQVTWSATSTDLTTTDMATSATFVVAAQPTAGSFHVEAKIGAAICRHASVQLYAPPAAGALRVVVLSKGETRTSHDGEPLAGAEVIVDGTAIRITGQDGIATFAGMAGAPHDLSVFAADHSYVSVFGTSADDVLVPLKATPAPGRFAGRWKSSDFDNLTNPTGTMHVSISGASVAGSLIDMSVSTLVGRTQSLPLDLGMAGTFGPYDVPESVALGLDDRMFGQEGSAGVFAIQSAPGLRSFWTFGGNAILNDVLTAVGPALFSSDPAAQVAAILTSFLPIIGSLESGVTVGLEVEPEAAGTLTIGGTGFSVRSDTLLRLRADVLAPRLPTWIDATGTAHKLDALVVVGGAQMVAEGFVPLGLTAGFDRRNADGESMPDQLTDPVGADGLAGHLPLRVAPRHGGVEGKPLVFLEAAISTVSLASVVGSAAATEPLVLAGRISHGVRGTGAPYALRTGSGDTTSLDLSEPFLDIPGPVTVDDAARTFQISSAPPATFLRIDLGPEDRQWSLYVPSGATTVSVPTVPDAFDDYFAGQQRAILHAVQLRSPIDAQSVWQFDGTDADDLSSVLEAFSSREVTRPVSSP